MNILVNNCHNGDRIQIDKEIVNRIVSMMDKRKKEVKISNTYVHKEDADQVAISEIHSIPCKKVEEIMPGKIVFGISICKGIPNYSSKHIFDHELDHIPVSLINEMGRQMALATNHTCYEIPIEGTITIGKRSEIEYLMFIELDKPFYIICIDEDIYKIGNQLKRKSKIVVVQEKVVCSSSVIEMMTMNKELYMKLRRNNRKIICGSAEDEIPTNKMMMEKRTIDKRNNFDVEIV